MRVFRMILDSEAPPVKTKEKPAPYTQVDVYAAPQGIDTLGGIGGILRPHQEAANVFSAALDEGKEAEPPDQPKKNWA